MKKSNETHARGKGTSSRGKRDAAPRRAPMPLPLLILTDVVLVGIALVIFALPHHVLPRKIESLGIVSARSAAALPAADVTAGPEGSEEAPDAFIEEAAPEASAAATPEPTPEATPEPTAEVTPEPTPEMTPEPVGSFANKFADKFTDGEVVQTDTSYVSKNLNVQIVTGRASGSNVFAADIYIRDISCLQTVFAKNTFGKGINESVGKMASRVQGIVSVNGDYYGAHPSGIVLRNGILYRDKVDPERDVCALFWDGTMETYPADKFDLQATMQRGVYQIWCFGPALLNRDGEVLTSFNSNLTGNQPRAAIGYFEPGHYCFVVVDGRTQYSKGVGFSKLAELMKKLGCVQAYNLDGGRTAQLLCGGKTVNHASGGGRACSDIITVVDSVAGN